MFSAVIDFLFAVVSLNARHKSSMQKYFLKTMFSTRDPRMILLNACPDIPHILPLAEE